MSKAGTHGQPFCCDGVVAREDRSQILCDCGLQRFFLEILSRQNCSVRCIWPAVVFVELLAAAGAGCARECDSSRYARVCRDYADFGAAVHLAGRDANGSATARCWKTAVAGSAFFCSSDQSPVLSFALRDGVALGDGGARSITMAGDAHTRSMDSAERDRCSGRIHRDDDCDWFYVYGTGDGSASVLRLGVVCSLAVLPRAVFGAGIQLPRTAIVFELHGRFTGACRLGWRDANLCAD